MKTPKFNFKGEKKKEKASAEEGCTCSGEQPEDRPGQLAPPTSETDPVPDCWAHLTVELIMLPCGAGLAGQVLSCLFLEFQASEDKFTSIRSPSKSRELSPQ